MVVSKDDLDELHSAIEKYEASQKQAQNDNAALLKTNLQLISDQKKSMARMIVAGSIALQRKGFTGLNDAQVTAEIETRSGRQLNSLQDALADLLKELPGADLQATSESKPNEEIVRQVADNAKVTVESEQKADNPTTEVTDNKGEKQAVILTKLVNSVTARRMAARARFQGRKTNDKE
jgi:hypothetical protein